ncbi:MAG TPA: AAA family ATPase [Chthoniobacteraceae bacterium]|nr:AAA family ATPase [Chthoniobacteraceae bacterium]
MRTELARVIIGQDEVIDRLLITIFARGHGLLVGVPGLAKTLLVRSIADAMSLEFSRVQFTPDLMPSDITGTEILQESDQPGRRRFEYVKGPIFANIVLADEINRAPPKTQSALLEAMQEHRVTAAGHIYHLPEPFFVLATQNPVEQEGTYPLPEAQLDRFMFLINVGYPSLAEEGRIARETTGLGSAQLTKTITGDQLIKFQDLVRRVPVPDHIYDFVVNLVRSSRPGSEGAADWIKDLVTWGAGPRAIQYLILGAKARAALQGSYLARIEDVEALAEPVLIHRILTSFHAQSEGITSREIIKRLIEETRAEAAKA